MSANSGEELTAGILCHAHVDSGVNENYTGTICVGQHNAMNWVRAYLTKPNSCDRTRGASKEFSVFYSFVHWDMHACKPSCFKYSLVGEMHVPTLSYVCFCSTLDRYIYMHLSQVTAHPGCDA